MQSDKKQFWTAHCNNAPPLAVQRLFWLLCLGCAAGLQVSGWVSFMGCVACALFQHRRLTPQSSGTPRWCASPLTFDVRPSSPCSLFFVLSVVRVPPAKPLHLLALAASRNLVSGLPTAARRKIPRCAHVPATFAACG